ncbi:MAG: hypothetical protein K2J17_00255 [Paramuribaculum sp.]|nr:hypothetical protein [Paramuribaculum sp.]
MKRIVIAMASVVEQTLALSALHGCLSGGDTPVLGTDREAALRMMMPPLAATLALSLGPAVAGWESGDDMIALTLREVSGDTADAIAPAIEQWLARMLASQLWASAAPALAREASAEASRLGELIAAGLTAGGYPATVRGYDY